MKKTSPTARKLNLRKETLRTLNEGQLARAGGGLWFSGFWNWLSGAGCAGGDDGGGSAIGVRG